MNHRICFLTHNYRGLDSSGNKAKHDNEVTLREIGAVNLGVPTTYYDSKVASFFLDLAGVVKLLMTVSRGDIVVLQYPVKKYFAFVCNMAHAHGAKVVAIIHDLGSMRRRKLTVAKEIRRLMHADYVIASNPTMKDWLSKNGFTNGLGALAALRLPIGIAVQGEITREPGGHATSGLRRCAESAEEHFPPRHGEGGKGLRPRDFRQRGRAARN